MVCVFFGDVRMVTRDYSRDKLEIQRVRIFIAKSSLKLYQIGVLAAATDIE